MNTVTKLSSTSNRKYIKDFSEEDVRKMFLMRSKGIDLTTIGNRFGVSAWTSRQIIQCNARPDVEISEGILDACKANKHSRSGKPKKGGKKPSRNKTITDYIIACDIISVAKAECRKAGWSDETLELLREAVRDQV
jgi:hypothetical protein